MRLSCFAVAALAVSQPVQAQPDPSDAKFLTQPAINGNRIAFIHGGDLYVADLDGAPNLGTARQLTSDAAVDSRPALSPDGRLIAFSSQRDGNTDVYVVPTAGGAAQRLTWHPDADLVQAFTPDGKEILFTSARATFTVRHTQLFTVPVQGGFETALPIPNAARAAYSPDAQRIAYNPLEPRHLQWKQYRGGTTSRIWIFNTRDHAIEAIAQPVTRANDVDPLWFGDNILFRSDRQGEFNLFSYDTRLAKVAQLTRHQDFPVLGAGSDGHRIIYEQAGVLHLLDPKTGLDQRLHIGLSADPRELRPRFAQGVKWIRDAALSPSGARAAFAFRGEIVTVPAEKGDARNITNSPGAHDRAPAWSPDGRFIAWFSDSTGENRLHIGNQDGTGKPRIIAVAGAGFYSAPLWSPDSRRIAYADNSQSIYWLDVASGISRRIASSPRYVPAPNIGYSWSPDSLWLAYALNNRSLLSTVSVYSIARKESFQISDGLSDVKDPVFDRSGKYLYFLGSTDAGPVKDWFAQSSADPRATFSIYLAVLREDEGSPLASESDEEKAAADNTTQEALPPGGTGQAEAFRIDLQGVRNRILDLPIPAAELSDLQTGAAGHLYYRRMADGKTSLNHYDLNARKNETLLPDSGQYAISRDGTKLLYQAGAAWFIVPAAQKPEPGSGRIAADTIQVRVEPAAEWRQIFDEAWRINRDYFYDPGMHGVDWREQREKYRAFLPYVTTREDLNRLIQWMCSELAVGHHRVGGGDHPDEPRYIPGGLLGADYELADGRYRLKKVFGGLNWNPQMRAPLTAPGINAKAGEYLLSVNGQDLRAPTNLYSLLENTANKLVTIELGPNADGRGARTLQVVPADSEFYLRHRAWIEENVAKVDRASGGRIAYVYLSNTANAGHADFKRYFFPQVDKQAVIIDERFNGGGYVPDYVIDILRRPFIANWAMRYGEDHKTPFASIHGPMAMIIDETAGSGGDLMPWMFRKLGMGPLIGRRTWGGLVGGFGFPPLMDGGTVTAPNIGIWSPEEGWIVENEGVPPDIEIEQAPAEVIAGHDPQLEKAVEVILEALRDNPPKPDSRPPFPVRGKTQRGTVPSAP